MNRTIEPLPPPAAAAGVDLFAALSARRSVRDYDNARQVSRELLSSILWAACGVSGPEDKRTAPSAFGGNQVNLYVVSAAGIASYDAASHALQALSDEDIRPLLAPDEWVGSTPLAIILTGRTDKFPEFATPGFITELLQATAGCIAENLHLASTAFGLGTCMVGHMNGDTIAAKLNLSPNERPLYVMPLGYAVTSPEQT